MVHKVLKKTDGEQTEEYRYYICSIGADAEEFERTARGHWGVENSLHWQIDFTFGEHGKNMCKEPAGHEKSGAVYPSPGQGQLQDQHEADTV